MKAREHTHRMCAWWAGAGVRRADVAVRRPDGTTMWHKNLDLAELPVAWAARENVRHADVYIRPARGMSASVVFLDDVAPALAVQIARKYSTLVVQTSVAGGCHVWLSCSRYLTEDERNRAQRWLAERLGADLASTSGEHLGRLAGFKNWKRGGNWVNVLDASRQGRPWEPVLSDRTEIQQGPAKPTRESGRGADHSPSGRAWAWACSLLEAGGDPLYVTTRLAERARARRGRDAERYAIRTVARALDRIELKKDNRRKAEKALALIQARA